MGGSGIRTSCWNKAVFETCGVRCPIRVLPHVSQFHGQAPGSGSQRVKELARQAERRFVFCHIGVWNERKATEALLHAYLKEFRAEEQVLLILKTGEYDWSSYWPRWRRWGRSAFRPARERFHEILQDYPALIHVEEERPFFLLDWSGPGIRSLFEREADVSSAYTASTCGAISGGIGTGRS